MRPKLRRTGRPGHPGRRLVSAGPPTRTTRANRRPAGSEVAPRPNSTEEATFCQRLPPASPPPLVFASHSRHLGGPAITLARTGFVQYPIAHSQAPRSCSFGPSVRGSSRRLSARAVSLSRGSAFMASELSDPPRAFHVPPRFVGRAVIDDRRREYEAHHVANSAVNNQSGQPRRNQLNGKLSVVAENFSPLIFLFAVRIIHVYKSRKKGGELMKIKVNVRAGGAVKAR